MRQQLAKELLKNEYNIPFAVKYDNPLVEAMTENKHGINNPVTDLNIGGGSSATTNVFSSGAFVIKSGYLKTLNTVPQTVEVDTINLNNAIYAIANVVAVDEAESKFGAFRRSVICKNTGSLSIFDQIKDDYTMRDDTDWIVDFTSNNDKFQLRVTGGSGQDVGWTYTLFIFQQ
jgi:hypothetical protein